MCKPPIRVLIIADAMRQGPQLRRLIARQKDMAVVGQITDAAGLITQLQITSPDVIIACANAHDVIRLAPAAYPAEIIVISADPEVLTYALAMKCDCLLSDEDPDRLLRAIRAFPARSPPGASTPPPSAKGDGASPAQPPRPLDIPES